MEDTRRLAAQLVAVARLMAPALHQLGCSSLLMTKVSLYDSLHDSLYDSLLESLYESLPVNDPGEGAETRGEPGEVDAERDERQDGAQGAAVTREEVEAD